MPRFDLSQYETVEERIRRFYETHEDGRIITKNLTTETDRSVSTWVVAAEIYLSAGDQAHELPKATGLAFEIDGGNGANATAALENAETSAIGRALANAGFSGNKRPTKEEMAKANRVSERDFLAEAGKLADIEKLRNLYAQAKAAGAPSEVLEQVKARAEELGTSKQNSGAGGRVSGGSKRG